MKRLDDRREVVAAGVVWALVLLVMGAIVVGALVLAPGARADESGSPSPEPTVSASSSPTPTGEPSPEPSSTVPAGTGEQDPPPASLVILDGDQYAFVQGAAFILIVTTLVGVIGAWGRRG